MRDIECPYCGDWLDINHDDGYGYEEDRVFQQHCGNCDKYFTYTTSIYFNYNAEQADCLNGGEHDFKPTTTRPKYFTKMRCSMCDEQRDPTLEEREKFNLPLGYED